MSATVDAPALAYADLLARLEAERRAADDILVRGMALVRDAHPAPPPPPLPRPARPS